MAEGHAVVADVVVRVRVGARNVVHQQRVALHVGHGVVRIGVDLHEAAVGGAASAAGDGLGHDGRRRVRRHVRHLRAGVLELPFPRERDGEHLTARVRSGHPHSRVLHGHLGADVAVDPLHGRALFSLGALGDQVVDVVGPVLDGCVPAAATLLHDDFHHSGVQRVRLVNRRGATLHVVHVRIFIDDDQRALKLAHVFRVNAEVRLQRDVHVDPRRNVDEGATRPHSGVERRELVVASRNDGAEVLLKQVLVLTQGGVGVNEDDTLFLQVLADLVVNHLGFVLGGNAGDETLLLRLGDAELVVGALNVLRQVVPRGRLLLGRAHVVLDVVKVDVGKIRAPRGHRLLLENFQCLRALVQHPLRLALDTGDVAHHIFVQATARSCAGSVGIVPTVVVGTDRLDDFVVVHRPLKAWCGLHFSHCQPLLSLRSPPLCPLTRIQADRQGEC